MLFVVAGCTASDAESTATRDRRAQATATATATDEAARPTATERLVPTATVEQLGQGPTATATPEPADPTSMPAAAPPEPTTTEVLAPPTDMPVPQSERAEVIVIEVIDGATLHVSVNGTVADVRLIGGDTPETKDPNEPVMCFGPEATAFTQSQIDRAGGRVLLEQDITNTDRYGRLLRYVWLLHSDGTRFLNEELVKQGYQGNRM